MKKILMSFCLIVFLSQYGLAGNVSEGNFSDYINADASPQIWDDQRYSGISFDCARIYQLKLNKSTEKDVIELFGRGPDVARESPPFDMEYIYFFAKFNAAKTIVEHNVMAPFVILLGHASSDNRTVEIFFDKNKVVREMVCSGEGRNIRIYLDKDGKIRKDIR